MGDFVDFLLDSLKLVGKYQFLVQLVFHDGSHLERINFSRYIVKLRAWRSFEDLGYEWNICTT